MFRCLDGLQLDSVTGSRWDGSLDLLPLLLHCTVMCWACALCWLQAWTFNNRAAIVIGVTEQSTAVRNRIKLQRLAELLRRLVEKSGDNVAVSVEQVCVCLLMARLPVFGMSQHCPTWGARLCECVDARFGQGGGCRGPCKAQHNRKVRAYLLVMVVLVLQ